MRPAAPADAEDITALINIAFRQAEEFFVFGERITLAEVRELMRTGTFLVAGKDGRFGGCVYVERNGERAYLGLLSVDPALQQSGLGSLLMEAAEELGRGHNCRFMDIKVVNLRTELAEFYRRRGYGEIGTSRFPETVKTKIPCHFIDMSKPLSE